MAHPAPASGDRHVQILRRTFLSGMFFAGIGRSIASSRSRAARRRSVLALRAFTSASVMTCAALVVVSPFVSAAASASERTTSLDHYLPIKLNNSADVRRIL